MTCRIKCTPGLILGSVVSSVNISDELGAGTGMQLREMGGVMLPWILAYSVVTSSRRNMPWRPKTLSERKLMEIEEIAAGLGKLLAREAFPEGPGLDVSLADMEDIVVRASRAIVHGAVETMAAD